MKNRFTTKFRVGVFLLFLITISAIIPLSAQVTIGKDVAPETGAILQLKEDNSDGSTRTDGTTADKGLLLPRVKLPERTKLYPMFGLNDTTATSDYNDATKRSAQGLLHRGLMVYNTSPDITDTTNGPLYNGLNLWDGTKWMPVGAASGGGGTKAKPSVSGISGTTCTATDGGTLTAVGTATLTASYATAPGTVVKYLWSIVGSNGGTTYAVSGTNDSNCLLTFTASETVTVYATAIFADGTYSAQSNAMTVIGSLGTKTYDKSSYYWSLGAAVAGTSSAGRWTYDVKNTQTAPGCNSTWNNRTNNFNNTIPTTVDLTRTYVFTNSSASNIVLTVSDPNGMLTSATQSGNTLTVVFVPGIRNMAGINNSATGLSFNIIATFTVNDGGGCNGGPSTYVANRRIVVKDCGSCDDLKLGGAGDIITYPVGDFGPAGFWTLQNLRNKKFSLKYTSQAFQTADYGSGRPIYNSNDTFSPYATPDGTGFYYEQSDYSGNTWGYLYPKNGFNLYCAYNDTDRVDSGYRIPNETAYLRLEQELSEHPEYYTEYNTLSFPWSVLGTNKPTKYTLDNYSNSLPVTPERDLLSNMTTLFATDAYQKWGGLANMKSSKVKYSLVGNSKTREQGGFDLRTKVAGIKSGGVKNGNVMLIVSDDSNNIGAVANTSFLYIKSYNLEVLTTTTAHLSGYSAFGTYYTAFTEGYGGTTSDYGVARCWKPN